MLPEAQLYFYKARVYDPIAGRFLQTDPIGYEGGTNVYGYVGGDPVNVSDPSGTTGVSEWYDKNPIDGYFGGDAERYIQFVARDPATGKVIGSYDTIDQAKTRGLAWNALTQSIENIAAGRSDVAIVDNNTLSYTTVSGGPFSNHWQIQWQLALASNQGGWIVQEIKFSSHTDDPEYTANINPHYWEAWQVAPGSAVTTVNRYHISPFDDDWADPETAHGYASTTGSAQYYDGLALPPTFSPGNVSYAGSLFSTPQNPNLTGGTNRVDRGAVHTW